MKRLIFLLAAWLSLTCVPYVRAGGGAQNVALVVNAQSWASLTIANDYIRLRDIPPQHVIYLDHVPNFETVSVDAFRDQILEPVLKIIGERHLTPQIDYLIYSSDMPYAIDTSADGKDAKLPKVITRTASITGLTFLHERVMKRDISYLQLNVNRYVRWISSSSDTALTEDELKSYVAAHEFITAKEKKYETALPLFDALAKAHPKNYDLLYNLACCLARVKKFDEAMTALNAAIDAGWFNAYHTREDEDFAEMRSRQDFKDALTKLEKTYVETQPEHGFRSSYAWNAKGDIAPDGNGDHYLLSTMLAVTSGRGTSVNEALAYLRRSAQVDGTRPDGTIYYMVNGDVRSKTRRWGFTSAVDQLGKLGVKAEILEGALPQKKPNILGLMAGTANFDFAASGSTILPGAICEHLTSNGGELAQHRGQTECTSFLRFGASGTSGAVQEPYALQQKFPTPFIHVHYARGCSLGESFYQSVSGPYQLIVLGDPLCAPWKRAPVVTLAGIAQGNTVKGTLALLPGSASNQDEQDVSAFELFVDGLRHQTVKLGETFTLDTAAFCDGYHDVMLVGISNDRIETQGLERFGVTFQNHGQRVALSVIEKSLTWDGSFHIAAQMPGATVIDIYANGRNVARIAGSSGETEIPARKLGLGTVTIQARGYRDEGLVIAAQSEPIALTIEPSWLPAQEKNADATKSGLRLELDDGTSKTIEPARDTKWLAAAGLTKSHRATLDAWFDAPADDLYQFQLHSPMTLSLQIDGKPQPLPATNDWRYLPLALKKGPHHLRLKVDAANVDPSLDIRFGASGTRSLEAKQFLCVEDEK